MFQYIFLFWIGISGQLVMIHNDNWSGAIFYLIVSIFSRYEILHKEKIQKLDKIIKLIKNKTMFWKEK